MSSDGNQTEPRRPSVFISYASEDRVASRALRDALIAAGLDVWYDESKLGGGDAWDQKIRRQIRDCEYFMPVISASTERRSEGYFRREWRLAAERTLDMADDVLFLLPVVIDDTSDAGARVPDKFLSVQWLRLPGGQATPELAALVQRLLRGEHHVPAAPRTAPTPRSRTAVPAEAPSPAPAHAAPPPMPPFPHLASNGIGPLAKFAAEVCWWVLTAGWMLFNRSPRLVRIFLTIWVAGFLIARCSRDREPSPRAASPSPEEIRTAIKTAAEKLATVPGVKVTGDILPAASGVKSVLVTPFGGGDENSAGGRFATAVFTACYGRLLTARPADAGMLDWPNQAGLAEFAAAARQAGANFALRGVIRAEEDTLVVTLVRASDGTEAWTKAFRIDADEPTDVAAEIATNVLALLPAKP